MCKLTLHDILNKDANLFNAVRLVAATCVIISHALPIQVGLVPEFLEKQTPYALSDHAVNVFFVLSGVLVALSFERSSGLMAFVRARLIRIFPAVLMCALLTAFVLGPLVTGSEIRPYFKAPETWLYPAQLGLFLNETALLPGVFEQAPMKNDLNSPIWTLRWELAAYAGIAMLGLLGVLRSRAVSLLVCGLGFMALTVEQTLRPATDQPDFLDTALRFGALYLLGAAFYAWRKQLPISTAALVILMLVTWLANDTILEMGLWLVTTGYLALWLGALNLPGLRRATEQTDLSYGLYIYGWPVTQALTQFLPNIDLAMLCCLAVIISGGLAVLSWHLIEKPALSLKTARASRA